MAEHSLLREAVKFFAVIAIAILLFSLSFENRFSIRLPLVGRVGADPNLNMTFACHGQRRIERYDGIGKPEILTEPVSHSFSIRRKANDEMEAIRQRTPYKTSEYIIDGSSIQILSNDKDQVETEKLGYVRVTKHMLDERLTDDEVRKRVQTVEFNFIAQSLRVRDSRIDWNKKTNTGQLRQDDTDVTRCERVTDPDMLEELSAAGR